MMGPLMTPLRVSVLVWSLLVHPAAAIDLAGTVQQLQGSAQATSAAGLTRPLRIGSTILVGDRVLTKSDSRLGLRMNDGAALALGDHTTLTVAVYEEEKPSGRAVLNLEQGVLLATSGAVARLGSGHFSVGTPAGILHIGDSEVWAEQFPDRLALLLLSGEGVVVTTAEGTVELAEAATGVEIVPGQAPALPSRWDWERLENARQMVAFR
jgi:hypothetical protein